MLMLLEGYCPLFSERCRSASGRTPGSVAREWSLNAENRDLPPIPSLDSTSSGAATCHSMREKENGRVEGELGCLMHIPVSELA